MKYIVLLYIYGQVVRKTKGEECYEESAQFTRQLKSNGQYLATNPLRPTPAADSVRTRPGKVLVTDGPFAETREQLGG